MTPLDETLKHLVTERVRESLYSLLARDHTAFSSYIADDIVDLVLVKFVPGYKGKWQGTTHEESAYRLGERYPKFECLQAEE